MVAIGTRGASTTMQPEHDRQMRIRFAAGFGGIAMGFVKYRAELPLFRAEVLPRLERAGVGIA